ncbi:MAG: hypothetical protein M0003_18245 [Acidithiobacillus sp.]|nr:hypothetical protein [Acidithiobacillus sp.]
MLSTKQTINCSWLAFSLACLFGYVISEGSFITALDAGTIGLMFSFAGIVVADVAVQFIRTIFSLPPTRS